MAACVAAAAHGTVWDWQLRMYRSARPVTVVLDLHLLEKSRVEPIRSAPTRLHQWNPAKEVAAVPHCSHVQTWHAILTPGDCLPSGALCISFLAQAQKDKPDRVPPPAAQAPAGPPRRWSSHKPPTRANQSAFCMKRCVFKIATTRGTPSSWQEERRSLSRPFPHPSYLARGGMCSDLVL